MTAEEAGTIWDRQADFLLLKGAQGRHQCTETRFDAISMVITFFGAALSKISRQIIWGFPCWGRKKPDQFSVWSGFCQNQTQEEEEKEEEEEGKKTTTKNTTTPQPRQKKTRKIQITTRRIICESLLIMSRTQLLSSYETIYYRLYKDSKNTFKEDSISFITVHFLLSTASRAINGGGLFQSARGQRDSEAINFVSFPPIPAVTATLLTGCQLPLSAASQA